MATQEIDQFVLAAVGYNWQKVAMLVARALTEPNLNFPEPADPAEFVARRIEELICNGQLESQGDTTNWRHSEVRRPQNSASAPSAGVVA